jgi:hypothetical protein
MTTDIRMDAVKGIYDTIDPSKNLSGSAEGKTIMITGAGRGKIALLELNPNQQHRVAASSKADSSPCNCRNWTSNS